jgi:hypothetical protein
MMPDFARQSLTIVEIDVPVCSLTYGSGACTASLSSENPRKCFNMFKGCQDRNNFAETTLTLRFAKPQKGLPKGQTIFPLLDSVDTVPAEINLSGVDPQSYALGRRERIQIRLNDTAYNDTLLDPYHSERISGAAQFSGQGYDPLDYGTLLTRLPVRWPTFEGAAVRIREGVVGQDFADMPTRHCFISEWEGPGNGNQVTLVCEDIFQRVSKNSQQVPAQSVGQLVDDLDEEGTTFTLEPAGVGDDYDAAGRIRISQEILRYTRVDDEFTIVERAVDGTEIGSHSTGDTAQLCIRYDNAPIDEVLIDLTDRADIPATYYDTADWTLEAGRWMGGILLTRTLSKPTDVDEYYGELCQLGCFLWWDSYEAKIKFRANRPLDLGESATAITERNNLIVSSVDVAIGAAKRISQLFFVHGEIDPTDTTRGGENYRKVNTALPEDGDNHDKVASHTIYCPWFGQFGDDAAARIISQRLLNRYNAAPRIITGAVGIKDVDTVVPAALVTVESQRLLRDDGFPAVEPMQITSVERMETRIEFTAETYEFDGRFAFITDNARGDYSSSSTAEQEKGTYFSDGAEGLFPDGTPPYVFF